MQPQPFWLVWCPTRSAPTVRQPSYIVAETEAKRLARINPGESFYVLAAVAEAVKADVGVTRFTIDPDHDSHGSKCRCDECQIPF